MIQSELVGLVNESLENPEAKVRFCGVFEQNPGVCLDNPLKILRVKAVKNGACLPKQGVWYAHYNLHDVVSDEYLGSQVKIPLEFLDRFRNGKDPMVLDMFIEYHDERRLDIYVVEE